MHLGSVIILFLYPLVTYQQSNESSQTYIGAVAEYSPVFQDIDNKHNVDNYLKFIKKAAEYHTDILVFPESSLSIRYSKTSSRSEAASYIPDPKENITPCGNESYAHTLRNISCAAKDHKMYIVINHKEKVDYTGENSSADGLLIYNTNVVFDRSGRVIARYRKYNLFLEPATNVTSKPIPSYFKTDFNVTFGQFICFDILFEQPTLNITRDLGIKDIVYSANWVSVLPFAFSFEAQAAWAYSNDVNFLGAGSNNQRLSSGGTGIYLGKNGYLGVSVQDRAANTLMVAKIPKIINGKRLQNVDEKILLVYKFNKSEISTTDNDSTGKFTYSTSDIKQYTTELIDVKQKLHNKTICDHNLCCQFQLEISFDENVLKPESHYYKYRFVVFNGTMSFIAKTAGVKICGIIPCLNDSTDGCGKLFDSNKTIVTPATFKSMTIKMMDDNSLNNKFMLPITLSKNMMPLNVTEFSFSTSSKDIPFHSMQLSQPRNDLLTFAIFGRNFNIDGSELTSPSSSMRGSIGSLPLIFSIIIALYCSLY